MFPVSIVIGDTDLKPLQIRALFRRLGFDQKYAPESHLMAGDCMRVWCYLLLQRLKFLEPEQRDFLFDSMMPMTGQFTDMAQNFMTTGRDHALPLLVIADGRYASWTLHTGWLDLVDGENLTQPRRPALETLGYNLAVMFQRNALACEELQRRANAKSELNTPDGS
jgi:hypothetical protein